jgi:hypothetical protein
MKLKAMYVLTIIVFTVFAMPAAADWLDNFDSYANGSGIIGQGGWNGWDGDPSWNAYVTDFVSRSGPHSLGVTPTSDVIQQFSGYASGLLMFEFWQYIPSTATGEQYIILLDTYAHGGPNHWAVQLSYANGVVESQFDYVSLPLTFDQWVLTSILVDLGNDNLHIEYDGDVLIDKPWTMGSSNDGLGILDLACLDLFSNGGDEIYYDDLSLIWVITATKGVTWSKIKDLY